MFRNDSDVEGAGANILVNCSGRAEHPKYSLAPQDFAFIHSNVSLVNSRIAATDDQATVIGVVIAAMLFAAINIEEFNVYAIFHRIIKSKTLSRAIVLAVLLSFSPLIIALTLLALLYKVLCYYIIRNNDKNFEAFLDGFDVFWSLEDGDGVALIEFLCHALADKVDNEPRNLFSVPGSHSAEKRKPATSLLDTLEQLCSVPICFVDGILRKPDEHSLHGPTLNGRKVFKWTDPEDDLFQMIKDIKQYNKELTFSDVLATSLSSGLRNYFEKTMDHIPEDVAVILPIRLPKPENEFRLQNNFTVTILDLPTKEKRPIKEIRNRCKLVRKSVDPMVNHYFLKVCYLLPKHILRPLFISSQATLIFSNMPGPDSVLSICGGSSIKSLVFFIPNKGTTGLGVSALYYGGALRFSAMADASLIPTPEQLSYELSVAGMESVKFEFILTLGGKIM
ncbi:unnamed protein product, partial [Iphiclides podalirius]